MSETAAPQTPKAEKIIPLSEIRKHNTVEDCWMAINGKVYDVTKFIDQHPGGEEVILEHIGGDATVPFEEIGHSDQAVEMLDELYVGEGDPEELKISTQKRTRTEESGDSGSSSKVTFIVCALVALAAYMYFKSMSD